LQQPPNFKRKERKTLSFPKNPLDPLPALEFFLFIPGKLTRNTSTLISIRQKQSVSYDLSYDGWPGPCGHWPSACARGNRERSCGDAYAVEMCASLSDF
jgi:hypothetical protein